MLENKLYSDDNSLFDGSSISDSKKPFYFKDEFWKFNFKVLNLQYVRILPTRGSKACPT